MGKYSWLCREIYMCLSTIPHVSFSQCLSILIDRGISAPGYVKDDVDGINSIYKRYIYQLMSNVQIPGSRTFDSQILMHYCTAKKVVSMAK